MRMRGEIIEGHAAEGVGSEVATGSVKSPGGEHVYSTHCLTPIDRVEQIPPSLLLFVGDGPSRVMSHFTRRQTRVIVQRH